MLGWLGSILDEANTYGHQIVALGRSPAGPRSGITKHVIGERFHQDERHTIKVDGAAHIVKPCYRSWMADLCTSRFERLAICCAFLVDPPDIALPGGAPISTVKTIFTGKPTEIYHRQSGFS